MSDESLMAAMALVMPSGIRFTIEVADTIRGATPPEEYRAGHERLLTYFDDLIDLRTTILDGAVHGDAELLDGLGSLGSFLADRAESKLWCSARADLEDKPIFEIAGVTFERPLPPAATIEQLCPA